MQTRTYEIIQITLILLGIFTMTSTVSAELKVESVYPSTGVLGQDLEVTLTGTGFDENTKIFMYRDEAIIGSVDTPGYAARLEVVDNAAYVTDPDAELQIIAYVADMEAGLQIVDVTNPAAPEIIGFEEERLNANEVAVSGTTVYVSSSYYNYGLRIIDVSNPHKPVTINTTEVGYKATGIAVVGNTAYVTRAEDGLEIIDISNPSAPSQIGIVDTPGQAIHVTVKGNIAFVGDGEGGLQVIDVSDSRNPHIIGAADAGHLVAEIAVSEDTAYMADGYSGLKILDVSKPEEPRILGTLDTPSMAAGLAVKDETAFIGDMFGGLVIIDVEYPQNPRMINIVETPGLLTAGVKVINDIAYVADSDNGLIIVSAPVRITSATVRTATEISLTLPAPTISRTYTLKLFNDSTSHESVNAVRFFDNQVSPASYHFPKVEIGSTSSPQTFSFFNTTDDSEIEIETLSLIGDHSSEFSIQADECSGKSLSPSDSCDVQVIFSPMSLGIKEAVLSAPLRKGPLSSLSVPLTGVGYDEAETYRFERMWPTLQQPWYFNSPYGITVDGEGFVYITDTDDHCIRKLTADGHFVSKWGRYGNRDGEFNLPTGITADTYGFIYVSDSANQRIQKFTTKGQFVSKWEATDTQDEKLTPTGIVADSNFIYVADIITILLHFFLIVSVYPMNNLSINRGGNSGHRTEIPHTDPSVPNLCFQGSGIFAE